MNVAPQAAASTTAPPRRQSRRRGQLTHRRKSLIRERLEVAKALWANVATYAEVWMRLRNRIGGFTDVEVDRILTDPEVPGPNRYSPQANQHHFRLLRAFPHSDEPLKRDPARWARIHATKSLDAGVAAANMTVPAVDQVMNDYLDDVVDRAPPAAAAPASVIVPIVAAPSSSSSSSSSSESESDAEWVLRRRQAGGLAPRERERSLSPPTRPRLPVPILEPAVLRHPNWLEMAPTFDPMDADEGWDEDMQLAISESLRDVAPYESPRYIPLAAPAPNIANGVAPAVVLHAPAAASAANAFKCPICDEMYEKLYRLSFTCTHAYCAGCIVAQLAANRNALNHCPGCTLNRQAHDQYRDSAAFRDRFHFLAEAAVGVCDPHFLRLVPDQPGMPKVTDLIRSGVQLDAFFPPGGVVYWSSVATKCPHCRQRIVGTPSPRDSTIIRCTSAICGAVFCNRCNRDWVAGHVCPPTHSAEYAASAAAISSSSKRCPSCTAPVTHYQNHGCHRIRCGNPACKHRFCYICLAEVRPDEDDPEDEALDSQTCRCPPFCQPNCGCPPCPDCRPSRPCSMARDAF